MLTPRIEGIIGENTGKITLAKVNKQIINATQNFMSFFIVDNTIKSYKRHQ